jgi:exosortase B
MNTAAIRSAAMPLARKPWVAEWGPVVIGLAVLYIPVLFGLFQGLWATEEHVHGPIILALSLWLIYRKWPEMVLASEGKHSARSGWLVFVIGLLLYMLGQSQDIPIVQVASFIFVMIGITLVKRGWAALRVLWFPYFFMLFMLPMPGIIVSELTLPMKTAVSYVTENLLFALGYPIAREGVVLQIGPYQLLVADACAGLQTLLTLESLGLFYLNVVKHTSTLRNVVLACLIVPISFTANVIRVISLTLITYYFGDEAGQGFLHGFAGMVLFFSALVLIVGLDALLQWIVRRREERHVAA